MRLSTQGSGPATERKRRSSDKGCRFLMEDWTMRLPRMTTRRWIAAVAIVGSASGGTMELVRRRQRFLRAYREQALAEFQRSVRAQILIGTMGGKPRSNGPALRVNDKRGFTDWCVLLGRRRTSEPTVTTDCWIGGGRPVARRHPGSAARRDCSGMPASAPQRDTLGTICEGRGRGDTGRRASAPGTRNPARVTSCRDRLASDMV